ncbi:uncharacterized protein [Montipora foliosa]|uniref:uncharacterized protein n=1 Tax=Montipora foliosa TaxID=591990 RepID=UPI0035F1D077
MNLSPRDLPETKRYPGPDFKSRLQFDETVYKSATHALEAYIAEFEGGRANLTSYRRRPSDLLSPSPKFYFMDSLERRMRSPSSKSPAKKVDELLEWVNETYAKELSSKVTPFGYRRAQQLSSSGSDEGNMNSNYIHGFHSQGSKDHELSTLPSPSSSVVDLDSNAGTVETEVLLSSFKGSHTSSPGPYSSMRAYRSPPKSAPIKTGRLRDDGSTEYPSWVSGLGKEYPSWVEDLDHSTRHKKGVPRHDKNYSSSTSSTSESKPRRESYLRSSRSTPAVKVSDLQSRWGASSNGYHVQSRAQMPESRTDSVDWNDAASTDTDMLVSQSVYGPHPVNMGGNFHDSLYQDKRVERLKKESTKKLRKSTGRIKTKEHAAVSPGGSKNITYSPAKALRFSAREGEQIEEPSIDKRKTPVSARSTRDSLPDGSIFATLPTRYSIPAQNERYRIPDNLRLKSASPPKQAYLSPRTLTQYSQTPAGQVSSTKDPRRNVYSSKSLSHDRRKEKIDSLARREETDFESDDTDRVMRKSPTGIKMEKTYRDPNTMYPWKTLIQSSPSHDTTAEFSQSQPQYQSTPMVNAGSQLFKAQSSLDKQYRSSGVTRDNKFRERGVEHSEERKPFLERKAGKYQSTPKQVFASSSYRSRDARLLKSAQNAVYGKPPPAPRPSAKRFSHKRSKTVPDLRRIAISSATRPRHSRRSLDDDVLSVNTVDTENLITRPPMPVFDASPSLTTVSDSDTLVESEMETEPSVASPGKHPLSPRRVNLIQNDDKFSPTSVFASTNPHAAVRDELPEKFLLWKLDEDTKAPDSFIKKRFSSPKSGIISSFLEDCLSVENDSKVAKRDVSSPSARLSGKEAAPGPVEALKQMLFTMQDIAHHEALDNGDYYKPSPNVGLKSREELRRSSLMTDDQSERDLDVRGGEMSLQRAYHHLERLKRLVGKEDDRSSISSIN